MRRYGMPSVRQGWVRLVAVLAAFAMVATLGYSALISLQAPFWTVIALVALVVGLPILLLARSEERDEDR